MLCYQTMDAKKYRETAVLQKHEYPKIHKNCSITKPKMPKNTEKLMSQKRYPKKTVKLDCYQNMYTQKDKRKLQLPKHRDPKIQRKLRTITKPWKLRKRTNVQLPETQKDKRENSGQLPKHGYSKFQRKLDSYQKFETQKCRENWTVTKTLIPKNTEKTAVTKTFTSKKTENYTVAY